MMQAKAMEAGEEKQDKKAQEWGLRDEQLPFYIDGQDGPGGKGDNEKRLELRKLAIQECGKRGGPPGAKA